VGGGTPGAGPEDPAPSSLPPFIPNTRDLAKIWSMVSGTRWSLLLFLLPVAVASHNLEWGASWDFLLNFLVIIPLALLLGDVTEDLACRFGDVAGGLLNATFGNVVEIILSIQALRRGLYTVVSMTLIGSVLSNLLLVAGTCFFVGGLKYKVQTFSSNAVKAYASMLFLATIGVCIPSVYKAHLKWLTTDVDVSQEVLDISRVAAVILLLMYVAYLVFSLYTHHDLFAGDDDDEEEEVPELSVTGAMTMLTAITAMITLSSNYLTSSIEAVSESSGLNQQFIGVVLLPVIGNACEHLTAVMVAMKNKMDLSMSVALGSSIQIAIFAIPLAVIAGWVMGPGEGAATAYAMELDPLSTLMFFLSVMLGIVVISDGRSQWLIGLLLLGTYVLIGATYLIGEFDQ